MEKYKQVREPTLFFYCMVHCVDSTFDSDAYDPRVLTIYTDCVISAITPYSSKSEHNPEFSKLSLFDRTYPRIPYPRWKNRSFGMGMDEFQRPVQRWSYLHSNDLSIFLYPIGDTCSEFDVNHICPEHSFPFYSILLQRWFFRFHVVLVCQYKFALCSDRYFIDPTLYRIQRSLLSPGLTSKFGIRFVWSERLIVFKSSFTSQK